MKKGFILLILIATVLCYAAPGFAMLGPEPMPEGEGGVRILAAPVDEKPIDTVRTQNTGSANAQSSIQDSNSESIVPLAVIAVLLIAVLVAVRIRTGYRAA